MRKEILIAIILGTFFGVILAFGIWRANFAFKEKVDDPSGDNQNEEVDTANPSEFKISLTSPEENDIVTDSPTKITGITKSQNWLVVSSEDEDIIIKTENSGEFEEEVELDGGANQIILFSFNDNGTSAEKLLTFVYSSEFEKYIDIDSEEGEDGSDEEGENSIEEKIAKKVESTRKNSKAYIGTLTDITEDTFQIKNTLEEIQQISLSKDVDYLSVNKSTKTIDFEDVAIGDFIVAMGFVNGDEVLEAKRILVTDPLEEPERKILFGTIKEIVKKEITIEDANQEEYLLTFPRRWQGPEISELESEMKVLVVHEPDEDDLIIRTIEIISPSEQE